MGIWGKLTRLDADQIGLAIMSRLDGGALRLALALRIVRNDEFGISHTYKGTDAVSLPAADAVIDPNTGIVIAPAYEAGARILMQQLSAAYYLDDQDRAWTSLDHFFKFRQKEGMDFTTYVIEWNRLFDDAQDSGGLTMNAIGKAYMLFSRCDLPDNTLADLRLKVNGDLNRFDDMVRVMGKISKNEDAARDQRRGYKDFPSSYYGGHGEDGWHEDDWYGDYGETYYDASSEYWYEDEWDDEAYYDADDGSWWEDSYPQGDDAEAYKGGKSSGKSQPAWKGKKGAGKQCTGCGSKFHDTSTCPLAAGKDAPGTNGDGRPAFHGQDKESSAESQPAEDWYDDSWDDGYGYEDFYGKGKKSRGKGKGKGKGSRKGKGKYRSAFPRDSFGGKGKGHKGGRLWQKQGEAWWQTLWQSCLIIFYGCGHDTTF